MTRFLSAELEHFAAGFGRLWRLHRRGLPELVQAGAYDLFVLLRPYFIPDDDNPPAANLQAARADIRHLAPFLVRVAARS